MCRGCKYENCLWIPTECFTCRQEAQKDLKKEVIGEKKMIDIDLKDLGIFELMEILIKEGAMLEGCSMEESRNAVIEQVKKFLIKEIEWVGEMNEK